MSNDVELGGVPETMLWPLYNRAAVAKRGGGFRDPACVRIFDAIDYDYARSFGKPSGVHAERSQLFDGVVRDWLAEHPSGTVVELGAGLETQFQRCDNGRVSWIRVAVPEAIAVRERFLPESPRCRHIACSALDPEWIDGVEPGTPVLVTAQGLLMYFPESEVRAGHRDRDRHSGRAAAVRRDSPVVLTQDPAGSPPDAALHRPAHAVGCAAGRPRTAVARLDRPHHRGRGTQLRFALPAGSRFAAAARRPAGITQPPTGIRPGGRPIGVPAGHFGRTVSARRRRR